MNFPPFSQQDLSSSTENKDVETVCTPLPPFLFLKSKSSKLGKYARIQTTATEVNPKTIQHPLQFSPPLIFFLLDKKKGRKGRERQKPRVEEATTKKKKENVFHSIENVLFPLTQFGIVAFTHNAR